MKPPDIAAREPTLRREIFRDRPRAEARVRWSPLHDQAWVINATELMRRKSSQIAKVQPATMAKLAFSTLVITGFIVLYPLLSFSL